jgi:5'-nucleotidase
MVQTWATTPYTPEQWRRQRKDFSWAFPLSRCRWRAKRRATIRRPRFRRRPIAFPVLLNVNVPDVPADQLAGTAVTRLGRRHKSEPVIKSTNPRGETVYWIGAAGDAEDAGEGTDFHAVANRMVSVTPLQIDLTQYARLESVRAWLKEPALT